MTFASFLSDPVATRDRGEWWVELYLKNPSGVETITRFSYRGTSSGASAITIGSDTIAAHTPFRKRLVQVPTLSQSLWQSGKLLSQSLPSFGSIKLINSDGGIDQYHPSTGWQWAGCRIRAFFFDYLDISSTIGKTFDGYMENPEFRVDEVTIPIKGREDLFSVPISTRVYRGTGYMLELSGVRSVGYGTPAACDLRGSMTIERWIWIDTTPSANLAPLYGWNGATFPWRLNVITTRALSFRGMIAGVTQGPTTTTLLSTQTMYHVSVVVSGIDVTFYIWNDDAETLAIESFPGTFTSSTRDAQVGGTLVDNSVGTAVTWLDESRLFNYARTRAEIEADRFRELPSIPASCVHYIKYNDGSGTTVTDSSATAANGTITGAGTSTWLWANEGGPELAGSPKPDIWGERWGVAPVLVDPVRQGYQVAGGGAIQDVTTYEGGLSHTMDASSTSYRAYLTTTPAAAHSLRYLPRGLFKLGSTPTLPVSALVKGYNGGSLGYVNKADTITRDVITRRGPKLTDPGDLDTASFTAYATANPGIIGIYLPQPNPISAVLDSITSSGSGWWGYVRASTLFHLEKYAGPAVSANYNFTQRNIISIIPLPPATIVYEVVVRYRHNDVVLDKESQVAASVKSTLNWQQWVTEWQEQRRTDSVIRAAYPGSASASVTFETNLQYQVDAGLLADYLLTLLKGVKLGWSIVVSATGLQATIGQTCTLSLTLQSGSSTRLGLDGTKKYSIISVVDDPQNGTVKLDLWG